MIFIMETNNLNDCHATLADAVVKETRTIEFEINDDDDQSKNVKFGNYGWICPVCGSGCSPYVTVCPRCGGNGDFNEPLKVTYEDLCSNETSSKTQESNIFTTTYSVSGNTPKFENPLYS